MGWGWIFIIIVAGSSLLYFNAEESTQENIQDGVAGVFEKVTDVIEDNNETIQENSTELQSIIPNDIPDEFTINGVTYINKNEC